MNHFFVFCDGGSRGNPGPSACAFIIKEPSGKIIYKDGKYLGEGTNNIAEYQGVLLSLSWISKNLNNQIKNAKISYNLDSSLVVNQLNGKFKIKNANLRELILKIQILIASLNCPVFFYYIPREKSSEADFLVNYFLDKNLK